MSATATSCGSCGYDFPNLPDSTTKRYDLAYSSLADIALTVSGFTAALGCISTLFYGAVSLINRNFVAALLVAPVAFFLQLGMLVVFIRVSDR